MADGKLTITVDLDGSSAQQGVKQLKSLLSSVGDNASGGFARGTKSAIGFGSAMAAASAVIGAGMRVVQNSVSGAVDRVDTLNRFPKTMQLFGYSAQQSQGAINKLSQSIEGLPTTLDQAVSSAQQLTITTGSMSKGTDLAIAFNNAMIGYGATTENAGFALRQFNQSLGSGKMFAEEFNSIAEAAPGLMNKMAKSFGFGDKGVTKFKEALKNGDITAQQFADRMIELNNGTDGFAKMAQGAAGGIKTSFKNVGTAITKNLANMIQAFNDAAKSKGLGTIAENLDKVKGLINTAFTGAVPAVQGFVGILASVIGKVKQFYSTFQGTGAISALQSALNAIGGAIGHVFSAFNVNSGTITDFATTAGDAFVQIAGKIEDVANWISKLDPGTIRGVAAAIVSFAGGLKALKTGASVFKTIQAGLSALSANPLVLVAVGIAALIGWFIKAYTTSETFRNKVDAVVSTVGKVANAIGNFMKGVDPAFMMTAGAGILALIAKFKGFDFLKSFDPFSIFRKKAKDATKGAGDDASQSKGILEQIFTGIGTMIEKAGTGISTAAQGIGKGIQSALAGVPAVVTSLGTAITSIITGLGTAISAVATGIGSGLAIAFQGLGAAIAIVPPYTWLALGAAIIMVGIAMAIAGSQASGISQIFQTVGNVIVSILQQLTVSLATLIPIVASALAMLVPIVASAISTIVTAVAGGIATLVTAVAGGIAQLIIAIATGWAIVIGAVSSGIAMVVGAFSGLITAISGLVTAFGNAFQSMGQGIQAALNGVSQVINSFSNVISSVFNGASQVITSFGNAAKGILDGISGVITSVGNAAMNAGAGFKALAQGVVMITNTRLGDMAASLSAVAVGVGKIASSGAGLSTVGSAMTQVGMGMSMLASSATMAVSGLTGISTTINMLKTSLVTLPATMTSATSGFATFSAQAVAGVSGLSEVNAPIAALKAQVMTITPSLMMASAGFASFNGQAMATGSALSSVGARAVAAGAQVSSLGTVITASMASATSAITSAGTRMVTTMQQAMNMITNTVRNGMNNSASAVRNGGSQMVSAMQSSGQRLVVTTQQAMNQAVNAVRSARSQMVSAGQFMAQGVAEGMLAALPSITAAANRIVAEANRAAKAAADIRSPSHLFRDEVGKFITMGVAVGIERNTGYVDTALSGLYARVNSFSFNPESVIGVGKSTMSHMVTLKSQQEQALKISEQNSKNNAFDQNAQGNALLENLLDKVYDLEGVVAKGKQLILDTGALVGETTNQYDEALGMTGSLARRHKL